MRGEQRLPYLLILPSVIFMVLFFVGPLIEAVLLALRTPSGQWTLANLQRMANDLAFADALRNTLLLAAVVVPAQVILALAMGLLLGGVPRGTARLLSVHLDDSAGHFRLGGGHRVARDFHRARVLEQRAERPGPRRYARSVAGV